MAKKELPEDDGPSQEWLASYADAMTLLLAFFIMMFAFALIDEGKYFDFKVGVMAALGVPDPLTDNTDSILSQGTGITPEIGFTPVNPTEEEEEQAEQVRQALAEAGVVTPENAEDIKDLLTQAFAEVGASEFVDVGIDERGVFIRFDGRVLFASGQAELDNDGLTLLSTAADVLSVIDNRLEIEGHTDSQPTGGTWASNWELSVARSARVVRWLIDSGIPEPQLVAMGMADTRPRADNATEEGRRQNRRVEIVIRVDGLIDSDVPVINPELDEPIALEDPLGNATTPAVGGDDPDEPVEPIESVELIDPIDPLADPAQPVEPDQEQDTNG